MKDLKMKHFTLMIAMIAAVSMGLIGCGSDDENLRGEFGSQGGTQWDQYYNDLNEEPGFGDPEILAMAEDALYNDPFNNIVETQSLNQAIYIRVLWGNLIVDFNESVPRDYSGIISIDDGAIVVERTIKFENHDTEIDTRIDPRFVAWKSRTLPHYDGLVIRLEPGATQDEENLLHIQIGPYQAEFTVSELTDLIMLDVTGYGNDQVAIASHLGDEATSGFVSGHWRDLENHDGGIQKGKWETSSGTLLGHERCRYLPTGDGEGEIKGKYIDTAGIFQGYLLGEYRKTSTELQIGEFEMDWLDAGGNAVGVVEGIYFKNGSAGYGFALANWWKE